MKKLICMVLCVLLLFSLAACQSETKAKTIEPPVSGLTWGMTVEEAKTVLVKGGLAEDKIVFNEPDREGHAQILLSAEQCKTLKVDPVPACPLSEEGVAVTLFFLKDTEDKQYLGYVYADATAEKKADVAAELTKLYGKETGDNFWEVDSKQVNLQNGASNTEFTVEYNANDYVKENFGKF